MRYKDLLVVVTVVAIGAWALAKPSDKVRVAASPAVIDTPSAKSESFPTSYTIENPSTSRPGDSPYLGGDPNYGTWNGLKPDDFKLTLTVVPGVSLAQSYFIVTFLGPEGYQETRTTVEVTFDGKDDAVYFVETLPTGRAVFRVSDLSPRTYGILGLIEGDSSRSRIPPIDQVLSAATYCQAEVGVRDPRAANPASRGATYLYVQSPKVKLR